MNNFRAEKRPDMPELLLEYFSEELPASYQFKGAQELAALVKKEAAALGLECGEIRYFAGPRRITLHAPSVPERAERPAEEVRGPRKDAPQAAVEGFARSCGVAVSALETRETPKGTFYVFVRPASAEPAAALLTRVIALVQDRLSWPKTMQWGAHALRWPRPLHTVLAVFGGEILPLTFGHLTACDRVTAGPVYAPVSASVRSFEEYYTFLQRQGVRICGKERAAFIRQEMHALAQARGVRLREDSALIEEIAGLCESPSVLCGSIDADFLELPAEVIVSVMRKHQRYAAAETEAGALAPIFLFAAERVRPEHAAQVIAGNERVLRARLSDALFFRRTDLQRPEEERLRKLEAIMFRQDLGSIREKTDRISSMAAWLADRVPGAHPAISGRAAFLAKQDLGSGMVGEFPELQGYVGGEYALAQGEHPLVAQAAGSHYLPQGPDSRCPQAPDAVCTALADKLDSLTGLWTAGERATGSGDAYGLRRYANGISRLLLENGLRLSLTELLESAAELYPDHLFAKRGREVVAAEIRAFIGDRLRVWFKDTGFAHDHINAVMGETPPDDVNFIKMKLEALRAFAARPESAALTTVYKRAANILAQQEKEDGALCAGAPDASLFERPEEHALFERLGRAELAVRHAAEREDFAAGLAECAGVLPEMEAFFTAVMVNAEDPKVRANRLALLAGVRRLPLSLADFSKLQ